MLLLNLNKSNIIIMTDDTTLDNIEMKEAVLEIEATTANESKTEVAKLHVNAEIDAADKAEKDRFEEILRVGFVRKVYGILSFQFTLTFSLCALSFNASVREFMLTNDNLSWYCFGAAFFWIMLICCSKTAARKVPYNYVVMLCYTSCVAYLIASFCARFDPRTVILASFGTMLMTVCLTVYSLSTDYDLTLKGLAVTLSICGALLSFLLFFYTAFQVLISILGLFVYALYLMYDTQLMFGRGGVEMDDYLLASVYIYLDTMRVFMYVIQIVAICTRR